MKTWDQELKELSDLWDIRAGWELQIYHTTMTALKVVFADNRPSVKEMVSLRKLIEEYRYLSPSELRDRVGNVSALDLGSFPPKEAQALQIRGQEYGLDLVASDASYISYLPTNGT